MRGAWEERHRQDTVRHPPPRPAADARTPYCGRTLLVMVSDHEREDAGAAQLVGTYHEEQLRQLLEHVRAGFAELDAGRIDVSISTTWSTATSGRPPSYGASAGRRAVSGCAPPESSPTGATPARPSTGGRSAPTVGVADVRRSRPTWASARAAAAAVTGPPSGSSCGERSFSPRQGRGLVVLCGR